MAYQIFKFDDVMLPINNSEQAHNPGQVDSSLALSVGGAFDYWGSLRRNPLIINVDISGWYVGEQSYEVDESDNRIVDESGNYIVSHGACTDVLVQVSALQSMIGTRASLWRRWIPDTTIEQWKTARLVEVPYVQSYEDGTAVADISCVFETKMVGWRASTQTSSSTAVNSDTTALNVFVGGDLPVDDGAIQIAASGSAITSVTITNADEGIDLRYTGTIADGTSVFISCDTGRVLRNGIDRYSEFELGANHTARCWLPLAVGRNPFMVTVVGQGTVYIRHYNQWA